MIPPEDAWWLATLSTVVFITYLYHLARATGLWWQERSYRSIRNLFIAVMLQIGLLRIVLGAFLRAMPGTDWLVFLNNATAPILYVLLLSGGVVLAVSWIIDDRERKRNP